MEVLSKKNDCDIRRNIQRSLGCAAKIFGYAIDNLLAAGIIEEEKDGRKKMIRLAD